jgi:uncharacterized membrane protein YozB (DUF420 family)
MSGLFPNPTSTSAELVLVIELVIAGLLVVGWVIVRLGHVRAHRALQSSMVLVNIPIVLVTMLPGYLQYIWPGLPGTLGQPTSFYPTIMLVAGIAAEVLGVYIILVAGTSLIPERFRFRRYKLWMRTELGLWWVVVLAGIATYYLFWVQPS